ncbi:hypothetical protein JUJ52_19640 [Virgibacillus sp. AGTR]|uniref:hypothetical protein n=1 Tax=Virgibacillus sp. AGTR TaxID=2812055 RepID=UPI001D1618C7|nr:hypothetical protein [Virgibacillus sp. AGTR]MCC2252146.1 hypothetical protein [Virgibacillus sp. AGTR]
MSRETCSCGRKSHILHLAGGRAGDLIKGENELLGDIFFKRVINDLIEGGYDCIEGYRVEQIDYNQFQVYLVTEESLFNQITDNLISIVRQGLGPKVEVNVVLTDEIPPLQSGKTRTFYSHI